MQSFILVLQFICQFDQTLNTVVCLDLGRLHNLFLVPFAYSLLYGSISDARHGTQALGTEDFHLGALIPVLFRLTEHYHLVALQGTLGRLSDARL